MKIPDAPYYVCATDRFMSGWGQARGMTNRVVLPCRDIYEAHRVAEYAESRSDMMRVTINTTKPKARRGVLLSVMTRDDSPAWYRYGSVSNK